MANAASTWAALSPAHEMAHQWWGHQVDGADKQGMTLLTESFAQYSAMLVMEKLYGKEQIRQFLKFELDRYLRERGSELIEELPLARVENQSYIHYRKGAVVMYSLKELVGEAPVNRAMRQLIEEFGFKGPPYADSRDFLRLLRAEAGPQHEAPDQRPVRAHHLVRPQGQRGAGDPTQRWSI